MVKSVLGKLIQREFGKERYACYADKLKRKQSMDVFCDIYEKLSHSSEEELDLALKGFWTPCSSQLESAATLSIL